MSRKKSKPPLHDKSRRAKADQQTGPHGKSAGSGSSEAAQQPLMSAAGMRGGVESVWIAFVLAFLFRPFEAEAFVIPTGSMAPTLMGRHKDVVCPVCGYRFTARCSEEADRNGDVVRTP